MSGSYTNTDGRSESLNQGAAHDTGLYDPNRYDNQIVAVYETRARAQAAKDALLAAGIPESAVQVLDRTEGDAVGGVTRAEDRNQDEGFWGAIKDLFVPDEDRSAYGHAIDRGHAMVLVVPSAGMDRQRVIEVLEASDPIDFDAKLEEWRQAGYDYSSAPRATERGGAGTGYKAGADTSSAVAAKTTGTTQATAARTGTAATQGLTGDAETIKVVEERLRIGKREVAKGAVRVRSYVVERPVEEQVRLHEERISVERRPVDRPVTPGDAGLFQERTIEARATAEEAVVQKEARVVEEVGIRKEATDRTETVRDTVRETKVEVDDQATRTGRTGTAGVTGTTGKTGVPGTTGSGMGTGGTTTNATPGATSSGTNSPRK